MASVDERVGEVIGRFWTSSFDYCLLMGGMSFWHYQTRLQRYFHGFQNETIGQTKIV